MLSRVEKSNSIDRVEEFLDDVIEEEWLMRSFGEQEPLLKEYKGRWENEFLDKEYKR